MNNTKITIITIIIVIMNNNTNNTNINNNNNNSNNNSIYINTHIYIICIVYKDILKIDDMEFSTIAFYCVCLDISIFYLLHEYIYMNLFLSYNNGYTMRG